MLDGLSVEAVYLPHQVRLYLFDAHGHPMSSQTISATGRIGQEGGEPTELPVVYTSAPAGLQDFLAASIDLASIPEAALTASFTLTGVSSSEHHPAAFDQHVHRTAFKPQVIAAELTADDTDGVSRQGTCPVMNVKLGDHGNPLKVMVDGYPVYLCCKGCMGRLQRDALNMLTKAGVQHELSFANVVSMQATTEADAEAIEAQGTCPVTGEALGAHGEVLKVSLGDRSVFICCAPCLDDIKQNQAKYFPASQDHRP